jgi:hypothetical protein
VEPAVDAAADGAERREGIGVGVSRADGSISVKFFLGY